jgi:hypothetical protein
MASIRCGKSHSMQEIAAMARYHAVSAVRAVIILCFIVSPSNASSLNILIIGENHNPGQVTANTELFQRAFDTISDLLHAEGFDVFDIRVVQQTISGNTGISRENLFELLKTVNKPKIDVAASIEVYVRPVHYQHQTKVEVKVKAKLFNVVKQQHIGNIHYSGANDWTLPRACSKECFMGYAGKYVEIVGADIAVALASKMEYLRREKQ